MGDTPTDDADIERPAITLAQAVYVLAGTTLAGLASLAGEDQDIRNAALALLLHDLGAHCKDKAVFARLARAVADTYAEKTT